MQASGIEPPLVRGVPVARPAVEDDLKAIIHVQERAIMEQGPGTYGRAICEAWARVGVQHTDGILEQGEFFVVDGAGGPVGVSGWSPDADRRDTAWIRYVFVMPESTGTGLGRLLVQTAEHAACDAGRRRFLLWSSLNAVGFYRRLGYRWIRRALWPVGADLEIEYVLMSRRL